MHGPGLCPADAFSHSAGCAGIMVPMLQASLLHIRQVSGCACLSFWAIFTLHCQCSGCPPVPAAVCLLLLLLLLLSLWLLLVAPGSDTTSGPADGDRTQPNAADKREYGYTCSPGTYIRKLPLVVDNSTRQMLGISRVQCSSADGTGSSSSPSGWGIITAPNTDEVPYNLPKGFRIARVHSLRDRGIVRIAIPPNYEGPDIAAIDLSWNVSAAGCGVGNVAAGVYGRYREGSYVSTIGFVCRKSECASNDGWRDQLEGFACLCVCVSLSLCVCICVLQGGF